MLKIWYFFYARIIFILLHGLRNEYLARYIMWICAHVELPRRMKRKMKEKIYVHERNEMKWNQTTEPCELRKYIKRLIWSAITCEWFTIGWVLIKYEHFKSWIRAIFKGTAKRKDFLVFKNRQCICKSPKFRILIDQIEEIGSSEQWIYEWKVDNFI